MSQFRGPAKENPLPHADKLGLNVPDRFDRRHDLACQFLADPSTHWMVADLFPRCRPVFAEDGNRHHHPLTFEARISKGEGKYATYIGNVDLVIPFFQADRDPGGAAYDYTRGRFVCPDGRPAREHAIAVAVEVKTGVPHIGEIIRQVKNYREHRHYDFWLLATTRPITPGDVKVLANERITHARLGRLFEDWMARQATTDVADSVEF